MMWNYATVISVIGFMMLSACATITRETKEAWVVETDPSGATVSTSNGFHCDSTPCSLRMPRRTEFVATIEKEGYEPVTATVSSSISGGGAAGMAGNVLLGGIIGAGVDAGTGAMHSIEPNPLQVVLVPLEGDENGNGKGIQPASGPSHDLDD